MFAATAMPPDLMGSTEQHKEVWFLRCFFLTTTVIPGFWLLLLLPREKGWKLWGHSEQNSGGG